MNKEMDGGREEYFPKREDYVWKLRGRQKGNIGKQRPPLKSITKDVATER